MKKIISFILLAALWSAMGTIKGAYYLAGSMNDWNTGVNEYEFTPVGSNGVYMIKLKYLKKGDKFRITDGNGYNENSFGYSSSNQAFTFAKNYDISRGASLSSIVCPFTIYDAEIYLHPNEPFIYVGGTPAVYIIGDWGQSSGNWSLDSGVEMEPLSDDLTTWYGKFYGTRSGTTYNYFRFKDGNSEYGPESTTEHRDVVLNNDEKAKKGLDKKCFRLNEEDYYFVTYTKGDSYSSFTVSKSPSVMYVCGDLKRGNWKQDDYYRAVSTDGVFRFDEVFVRGVREDKDVNYLAFFSSLVSSADGLSFSDMLPRYGGDESETTDNTNVGVEFSDDNPVVKILNTFKESASDRNAEYNFLLPEGMYDIVADINKGTVSFNRVDLSYKWHDADGNEISSQNHPMVMGRDNKVQISSRSNLHHRAANLADFKIQYETPVVRTRAAGDSDMFTDVTGNNDYYEINANDSTLSLKKIGNYLLTASLNDDYTNEYTGINPVTLAASVAGTYSLEFDSQAWSKDGIEYSGVVRINAGTTDIDPSLVAVTFSPGSEGEWLQGSARPEGLWDAEWNEWQMIEAEGEYVDGYWNPDKVSAALQKDSEGYSIEALLPCSGLYDVRLQSDLYDLIPDDSDADYQLEAYPSIKNLWALETRKDDNGVYGPLCLNIEGITMNTNETNEAFSGWYMPYPFLSDGENKKIYNYENLSRSVVYLPGVYMAEMWLMATTTTVEPKKESAPRKVALDTPDLSGYTLTNLLDLSEMASQNGAAPGSNYEVNIVLRKNGASTPQIGNKSEEAFIVSPNLSAPVPTGVTTVDMSLDGNAAYYTLQGVKVNRPDKGVYIKIENGRATKIFM